MRYERYIFVVLFAGILLLLQAGNVKPVRSAVNDTLTEVEAGEMLSRLGVGKSMKNIGKFTSEAVGLYDFDKKISGRKETFLLKNNTTEHISRIKLKLVYKSPSGDMIDYREVMVECDLLPKTTRQVQIDSFDKSGQYYFYKNVPRKGGGFPFKVYYDLLLYDVVVEP